MNFQFEEKNGKITITEYRDDPINVLIPSKVNGMPVVCIGSDIFRKNPNVLEVTIPDSVTSIANDTFSECPYLTHIRVDSGNKVYKDIDGVLFSKDGKLLKYMAPRNAIEYSIPSGTTSIGDNAFFGCKSLTKIKIPQGVTSIGDYAFYECSILQTVKTSNGLISIGSYAFRRSGLIEIEIPDGVTSIKEHAFEDCKRLTKINIPEGVTNIEDLTFDCCCSLEDIVISCSVTHIGKAFNSCSQINHVHYNGSKEEWYNIDIEKGNLNLLKAQRTYGK
ncbi:MAG: leucine-rich repeat domain-containing protein [Clostridiaceae bacterium]|jgi:hypothetical protein|nr:leucine-rich repeat domain-containing protein [Clostridiaceae bacterium]